MTNINNSYFSKTLPQCTSSPSEPSFCGSLRNSIVQALTIRPTDGCCVKTIKVFAKVIGIILSIALAPVTLGFSLYCLYDFSKHNSTKGSQKPKAELLRPLKVPQNQFVKEIQTPQTEPQLPEQPSEIEPTTQPDESCTTSTPDPTEIPYKTPVFKRDYLTFEGLIRHTTTWTINENSQPTTQQLQEDFEGFVNRGIPGVALDIQTKPLQVQRPNGSIQTLHSTTYRVDLAPREVDAAFGGLSRFNEKFRPGENLERFLRQAEEAIGGQVVNDKVDWTPPLNSSYQEMLSSIFERYQGLCIGEAHHTDTTPKQFLIDHMEHLKEQCGVETLFLEHILYDTIQPFLDDYIESPRDAEMPLILSRYLAFLDLTCDLSQSPTSFKAVVEAAKRNGIRVVAIDTSLSYEAGFDARNGSHGRDRMLGMNYAASKIIPHEAVVGNYVTLIGCMHGSQVLYDTPTVPVPGVAELLQIPFIILEDSTQAQNEVIAPVTSYKDAVSYADVLITGYAQVNAPLSAECTTSPDADPMSPQ